MRHLLSPPIHSSRAAKREWLLAQAETLAAKAEANEFKSFTLIRACKADLAKKGAAAKNLAKFQRERARQFIAAATDLTDYTDALDRSPTIWLSKLEALALDAQRRALSPAQLHAMYHNPYQSALHV